MSILSGYDKYKRYQKVDDENYKLISHWTSSNTVHFDDDSTAEEKVAEIDNSINEINTSIGNINTSIEDIEGDLSNLNTEVENLKQTTSTSNENIAKLESEKATRTELAETNENLTGLTDRFNYHEENSQKAELISYDNRVSGLSADKVQGAIDSINTKADEAITVAKGKNRSTVFDTTQDMYAWLSDAENKGKCQVGDNLYIVAIDVPDWWVSEVLEEADPDTGYYYKVAQLETQKVDLGSLEDEIAGKVAKLDDALVWQGAISGDDWATAQLGVWITTTANDTYDIPGYSVIYKPRPTSFTGAFINCYANGTQRGIYAWDASESKFIRLPRMDELDTKLSTSGGQITGNITTVEGVTFSTNGNIHSALYGGYLSDLLGNYGTNITDLVTRFGKTCTQITDWNEALDNGFYMAPATAANTPSGVEGWLMGIVYKHNSNYIVQQLWNFTAGDTTTPCAMYFRQKNTSWRDWSKISITHLKGLTSNVQTQLDAKLPLAGGTLTGQIYTGNVYPSKSSTYNCGRIAEPWAGVYSNNFTIIGSDNKSYVVTKATLGTTSVEGSGDLWLGTNIAKGTAGNAQGRIIMYNSGTVYAVIQDNDSATANRTFTLPKTAGILVSGSVSGTTLNLYM